MANDCIDCISEKGFCFRPTKRPGPRCATHARAQKKRQKIAAHHKYVERTYGITGEQYDALYAAQDGRCYICRRARGTSKFLAVEHDHKCCAGPRSCGRCVRCLACGKCNLDVLGHLRDDVEALHRAIEVIRDHPAQEILNGLNE